MASLLVTGGDGMVAQHVGEAALKLGHRVTLADRIWTEGRAWVGDVERVTFDIRDQEACFAACQTVDSVIHCAAVVGPARSRHDPLLTLAVNVTGTAHLLEGVAARGGRLINVSTATLYGHRTDLHPLSETDAPDPLTVYDGTKLASEIYCASHRRTFGSSVASVRTGFVFGFGNQIGEYFLPSALQGDRVVEPAGRDHPCDFTYVVDLAESLVQAAFAADLREDVYNITGGVLRTRGDLAAAVKAVVPGAQVDLGPGIDPARHLRGPCVLDRARRDLDWAPRFTLESGIRDWATRLSASA